MEFGLVGGPNEEVAELGTQGMCGAGSQENPGA